MSASQPTATVRTQPGRRARVTEAIEPSISRSPAPPPPASQPLVSVCTPVLNGGDLVLRAVESALSQQYPRVEVVVVDDASTDSTFDSLRARFGDQIKLFANSSRSGQGRTVNTAISHSTGSLVKFLDHDDQLDGNCISTMVPLFVEHPTVGIAFSRRRLELHGVDEGPRWRGRFSELHSGFARLDAVNHGPTLFDELTRADLRSNWIGGPSSVMVRRSCLDSVGGFSVRTLQWTDFDLWVRILAQFDAAFIDSELSTYRLSNDSLSARNGVSGAGWLDRLWILENLLSVPAIRDRYPELAQMRERERHMAWRTAGRGILGMAGRAAP